MSICFASVARAVLEQVPNDPNFSFHRPHAFGMVVGVCRGHLLEAVFCQFQKPLLRCGGPEIEASEHHNHSRHALHWGGMTRGQSAPTGTPNETAADRLQAAVEELAQNVRVLTDIVDELREDLSWLTRNGVPHQPVTVLVHRMPHVARKGSNGSTEPSGGSLELSFARWPVHDPTVDTLADDQVRAAVIDDIVQRLAEPLGELAQEQLNILVSVIDHAHRELLKAIRQPQATSPANELATSASPHAKPRRRRTKPPPPEPVAPTNPVSTMASVAPITAVEPPPPPGKLF